MEKPQIRRIYRQFTPEERERWLKARQEVEQELPELMEQHRILQEAAREQTLSGALRRALHRCGLQLPRVAKEAGLTEIQVHEFLLGERNLRSDVLDRLANAIGFEFPGTPTQPSNAVPAILPVAPPLAVPTSTESAKGA
jgi:hypothetical protein